MRVELAADCRKLRRRKPTRETGCDSFCMLRIGWKFYLCPVLNGTVARPQELLAATLVRLKGLRNFASSLRFVRWQIPAVKTRAVFAFGFSKNTKAPVVLHDNANPGVYSVARLFRSHSGRWRHWTGRRGCPPLLNWRRRRNAFVFDDGKQVEHVPQIRARRL